MLRVQEEIVRTFVVPASVLVYVCVCWLICLLALFGRKQSPFCVAARELNEKPPRRYPTSRSRSQCCKEEDEKEVAYTGFCAYVASSVYNIAACLRELLTGEEGRMNRLKLAEL